MLRYVCLYISVNQNIRCLHENVSFMFTVFFEDIDECATNTDNCHSDATCSDIEGSFTCTCNAGYAGDGVTCTSKQLYQISVVFILFLYMLTIQKT